MTNKKERFTPGPWSVGKYSFNDYCLSIHESDNTQICQLEKWIGTDAEEESEANARLIAAAPDMLAVCEEMVHGDGTVESLQRALDLANIAIKKALGE